MKSIQNSEIRQKGEGAGRSLQCPTGAKGIQGSPEEIYLVRLFIISGFQTVKLHVTLEFCLEKMQIMCVW